MTETPLHIAARSGDIHKVRKLLVDGKYDVTCADSNGMTPLHWACGKGHVSVVRELLAKYYAHRETNRRHKVNTPLHVAALNGKEDVVLLLITEFQYDSASRGSLGRSLLHNACAGGNVNLVRTLVLKHGADIFARDDENNTPLHVAALSGKDEVAMLLIKDFHCDFTIKGSLSRSLLHNACDGGSVNLVRTLRLEYGGNITAKDDENNTPLHVAALSGKYEVAVQLIMEFYCNFRVKGFLSRSLLHSACSGGNIDLVQVLITQYGLDITARDSENNTPLHVAAVSGKDRVALFLITEFKCDVTVRGFKNRTLLHSACNGGNINLVQTLIRKYGVDIAARDDEKNTPLHVAALSGQDKVALLLITEFHCDVTIQGYIGRSLLHIACNGGNVNLVRTLILEHGANVTARDDKYCTPLYVAALCGKDEVLINLIEEFHASIIDSDKDGDTPLHICSYKGYRKCVMALLAFNAPILIRNKAGKIPEEVAHIEVKPLLDEYMRQNKARIYVHYDALQQHAKRKYSTAERITRIFVIGNTGVGKSTLIENLKRESLFNFLKVSESSVPPHTAGIIPSIHISKHYGRVLFYDFAGDVEYYSSHAAILENLASTRNGDNIFFIVTDLREESTRSIETLHYWLSFIQHQRFERKMPSIIIVGSHSDMVSQVQMETNTKIFHKFCRDLQKPTIRYFLLDCSKPNSKEKEGIQKQIINITKNSPCYHLSTYASVLLGLLDKDFKNVTACSIQTVISHIKDTGVHLPTSVPALFTVLNELHEIGLLFIVKGNNSSRHIAVLNMPQLTNEVHKRLFSKDAQLKISTKDNIAFFNVGIIPESVLQEILPEYITKECLVQLQYCQEISHKDIGVFPSLTPSSCADKTFLFFPALCKLDKSDVVWSTPDNLSYSIGWLARCTNSCDFFPSRFLHVLLLRLVFRFTLSVPTQCQTMSNHCYFQRRCTMWKTGVHWLMEEGVECMAELVDHSNAVMVVTKSEERLVENCISIFSQIVNCVMDAQVEFCHAVMPQFFLLDTSEVDASLDESHMFAMSDVERVLTSPQGKEMVLSVNGKSQMKRCRLLCLCRLTYWNSIFPFDMESVLMVLKEVIERLFDFGLCLGISYYNLEIIRRETANDISWMRREVVREWMSSAVDPPCWWCLVQALQDVEYGNLAKDIAEKYSVQVHLQEALLSPEKKGLKPELKFLKQFADVVECKWESLASILSLTSNEIKEMKRRGEELSYQDCALLMLKQWAARKDATYGQLCQRLNTITLFQHCNVEA